MVNLSTGCLFGAHGTSTGCITSHARHCYRTVCRYASPLERLDAWKLKSPTTAPILDSSNHQDVLALIGCVVQHPVCALGYIAFTFRSEFLPPLKTKVRFTHTVFKKERYSAQSIRMRRWLSRTQKTTRPKKAIRVICFLKHQKFFPITTVLRMISKISFLCV